MLIKLIHYYQALSPIRRQLYVTLGLPTYSCRHRPTCSQYAKNVILKYGTIRGSYCAIRRLLTCHPWSKPASFH